MITSSRAVEHPGTRQEPGFYSSIDLFAGSGAFSAGLAAVGFGGRQLLVDNSLDCVRTLRLNHPDSDVVCADVTSFDWSGIKAKLVVGGPPCQGFSRLGNRNDSDPRNGLYRALLDCVTHTEPKLVVVENVPRFLDVAQGRDLIAALKTAGYLLRADVVDCASFGAPQHRRRALIIAVRGGKQVPWPVETHGPGLLPFRTVADAFALLPPDPDGRNWHVTANLSTAYRERVMSVPPGGNRLDLPSDLLLDCWRDTRGHSDVMGRLRWSRPATTLRTEFFRPEKGRFLHPSQDRSISLREAARLQTFPDSYQFPSDLSLYAVARQIGNAVPIVLATAIGRAISETEAAPDRS